MQREIKRVPKDFDYPLNKVWVGYLNPYIGCTCPVCKGDGYSEFGKKYREKWYGLDTIPEKTKQGGIWYPKTHQYNLEQHEVDALWDNNGLSDFKEKPTVEQVNEFYRKSLFGHSALNMWICLEADAKKNGVNETCQYCGGNGHIRDEKMYENWEPKDPPVGDWYQLWETTSERSPKTPVFATPEELAQYCYVKDITIFGHDTLSYNEWLEFIKNGKPLIHNICDGVNVIV